MRNERIKEAYAELKRVYKGDEETLEVFLAGVLAKENILLLGAQGKGKTFLSEATATALNERMSFSRVQGTVGLKESNFLASYNIADLLKGEEKVVFKDFVKARIKFFDELNRTHPTVLNAIFSMLAERAYMFGNERIKLEDFGFIATINTEDTATFELPPPLLDRFGIVLPVSNPSLVGKANICSNHQPPAKAILKEGELSEIWKEVENVEFPEKFVSFLAELTLDMQLCEHTLETNRGKEFLLNFPACCEECNFKHSICSRFVMPSERFYIDVARTSKALAYLRGKKEVGKDEIKTILPYALYYRIKFTPQYLRTKMTREEAIKDILKDLEAYDKRRAPARELILSIYENPENAEEKIKQLEVMSANDLVLKHICADIKGKLKTKLGRLLLGMDNPEKLEAIKKDLIDGKVKVPNKEELLKQIDEKLIPYLKINAKIPQDKLANFQAKMLFVAPEISKQMREDGLSADREKTYSDKCLKFTAKIEYVKSGYCVNIAGEAKTFAVAESMRRAIKEIGGELIAE